jgi:hypothetical protein
MCPLRIVGDNPFTLNSFKKLYNDKFLTQITGSEQAEDMQDILGKKATSSTFIHLPEYLFLTLVHQEQILLGSVETLLLPS